MPSASYLYRDAKILRKRGAMDVCVKGNAERSFRPSITFEAVPNVWPDGLPGVLQFALSKAKIHLVYSIG